MVRVAVACETLTFFQTSYGGRVNAFSQTTRVTSRPETFLAQTLLAKNSETVVAQSLIARNS